MQKWKFHSVKATSEPYLIQTETINLKLMPGKSSLSLYCCLWASC